MLIGGYENWATATLAPGWVAEFQPSLKEHACDIKHCQVINLSFRHAKLCFLSLLEKI